MERSKIIQILREHEAELRASGVNHLGLFGSVVRGDNGIDSDVDLLADLDKSKYKSLFALGNLHSKLSDWLSCNVDLAFADRLRPAYRNNVLEEVLVVF